MFTFLCPCMSSLLLISFRLSLYWSYFNGIMWLDDTNKWAAFWIWTIQWLYGRNPIAMEIVPSTEHTVELRSGGPVNRPQVNNLCQVRISWNAINSFKHEEPSVTVWSFCKRNYQSKLKCHWQVRLCMCNAFARNLICILFSHIYRGQWPYND